MKKKTLAITTAALAILAAGGGGAYYHAVGAEGVSPERTADPKTPGHPHHHAGIGLPHAHLQGGGHPGQRGYQVEVLKYETQMAAAHGGRR